MRENGMPYWLPSGAECVVFQHDPTERLSVILPPTKRKIRRYEGVGTHGRVVTTDLSIPTMLYVFEQGYLHRMYTVVEVSESKLLVRDFRLANVHDNGQICWGSGQNVPLGIREPIAAFWESGFNDDLTRYPEPDPEDQLPFESSGVFLEWKHRRIWLKVNDWHLGHSNDALHRAQIAIRDALSPLSESTRHYITGVIKRATSFINGGVDERNGARYHTIRLRSLGKNEAARRLEGRIKSAERLVGAARAIEAKHQSNVYAARDAAQMIVSKIARYYEWVAVAIYHPNGTDKRTLAAHRADASWRSLSIDLSNYLGNTAFNVRDTKRAIARYKRLQYRLAKFNILHQQYRAMLDVHKSESMSGVRRRWWDGGGWSKVGESSNMAKFIAGTNNETFADEKPDGVLWLGQEVWNNTYGNVFIPMIRNRQRDGHGGMFAPVWKHPNHADIYMAVVCGKPFVGVVSDHRCMWKEYKEEEFALQNKAQEIFK